MTTLNIKDFGAAVDGVTDDWAAVAAAYSRLPAAGGKLYFPAGVTAVSRLPIIDRSGVFLVGDGCAGVYQPTGIGSSIHQLRPAPDMLVWNNSLIQRGGILGLNLDGNGLADRCLAVGSGSTTISGMVFEDVFFTGAKDKHVQLLSCNFLELRRVSVLAAGSARGVVIGSPSGDLWSPYHVNYDQLLVVHAAGDAIQWYCGDGQTFRELFTWANPAVAHGYGMRISPSLPSDNLEASWFYAPELFPAGLYVETDIGTNGIHIRGYSTANGQPAPSGPYAYKLDVTLN